MYQITHEWNKLEVTKKSVAKHTYLELSAILPTSLYTVISPDDDFKSLVLKRTDYTLTIKKI